MIKLKDLVPIHDLSEGKFRKGDRVEIDAGKSKGDLKYGSAPEDYNGKKGTVTDVLGGGDTISVEIDGIEYKKVVFSPDQLKKESLNEANYETYHRSATDAAQEAKQFAEKEGYEVNEDDWNSEVAMGGKYGRLRPSEGKTHRFSIRLEKNGKEARKQLHFQIHGMGSKYELNAYIQ